MNASDFERAGTLGNKSYPRRDVLKLGLAAGLTGAMYGAMGSPAHAAPKRGGHAVFVCGNASASDSFDPELTPDLFINTVRGAVHDGLFEVSSAGEVVPSLAADQEVNADATEWRFTLKDGATFHDGAPVRPDDVVATMRMHVREGSKSGMKGVLANMASVEKDGNAVIFKLTAPDADWPAVLAEIYLSILPSTDGTVEWRSGIGCGPYKLVELDPGVRARLERFEDDHRDDRGWFDSVELLAVNDGTARVNALITGQAHVAASIQPSVAKRLSSMQNVDLVAKTSPGFYTFEMQTSMTPVDDNNVRLALKHAIDRQEFVDKILSGFGEVGNDQPIGPTYQYHADLEQTQFDPEKARFHLKEAGLDNLDIELRVSDAAFTGSADAAALYSETANKSGITLTPQRVPGDGYYSDTWGKVPFFASYWNGRATATGMLSIGYGSSSSWNVTGFSDPEFDELVAKARAELDSDVRGEYLAEAQRIVHETGPSIIPAFFQVIDAKATEVGVPDTNFSPSFLDGQYAVSRWWFD